MKLESRSAKGGEIEGLFKAYCAEPDADITGVLVKNSIADIV